MNNREVSKEFKRIIENASKGIPVYIKNTGIRVLITKLEKNNYGYRKARNLSNLYCSIQFVDSPTYKALRMCQHYNLHCNSGYFKSNQPPNPIQIQIEATIKVLNLCSGPYETKASKILFADKVNNVKI